MKTAIVTDTNSGLSPEAAAELIPLLEAAFAKFDCPDIMKRLREIAAL